MQHTLTNIRIIHFTLSTSTLLAQPDYSSSVQPDISSSAQPDYSRVVRRSPVRSSGHGSHRIKSPFSEQERSIIKRESLRTRNRWREVLANPEFQEKVRKKGTHQNLDYPTLVAT